VSAKTSSLYAVQETLTELQGQLDDTSSQRDKMTEDMEQLEMQLGVATRHKNLLQEVRAGVRGGGC
jgi:peptidoglycan hydrolase CwlO-like protein